MRGFYYSPNDEHTRVPESINFGTRCVEAPRLEAAGIPGLLARLSVLEPQVKVGDWVQRGNVVLKARLPVFDRREAPAPWMFWIRDSFTYLDYELRSPVSGLVLRMEKQHCGYHGAAWATTSGMSLCYGENEVRPILLLPDDEPPPDSWSDSFYYESLARSVRINYPQLLYSHIRGYVRLADVLKDFDEEDIHAVRAFVSNGSMAEEWETVAVRVLADLPDADKFVKEMRAHDLTLRKKLKHIGGMAAE